MQNDGNYTETEDHEIQNISQNKTFKAHTSNQILHKEFNKESLKTSSNDFETASEKHSYCYAPYHTSSTDWRSYSNAWENTSRTSMRVCPVMHYTRAVDMQVTYRCRDGRFTVPVAFAVVVQKLLHHVLHPHKPAGHCFIDQRRVRPAKERLLQYFKMNFYNVTVLSPVPASYGRTTNQQQMGRG